MTDKTAEIRARHEAGAPGEVPIVALAQADADREFLLAEVERLSKAHEAACGGEELLRAEIERLIRLNKMLERNEREFLAAIGLATTTVLGSGHDPSLALSSMKLVVAKVERLRAENERLHNEDTKTRHVLKGWVFVCPDGGADPTHERVAAVVAEVERLRTGLHRVSLASQNSMSSKDECGRIARETLEAKP